MCIATFNDWIELIESLAVTAAAVVAIWVALRWRNDFIERRGLEIAEEVLVKVYEVKSELQSVGFSFLWAFADELRVKRRLTLIDAEAAHAFLKGLLSTLEEKLGHLCALESRSAILLGDEFAGYFNSLTVAYNDLAYAGDQLEHWMKRSTEHIRSLSEESVNSLEPGDVGHLFNLFGAILGPHLNLTEAGKFFMVKQAVGALEKKCQNAISGRATSMYKRAVFGALVHQLKAKGTKFFEK